MQKTAFSKIPYPFLIKTLSKLGKEGIFYNLIKSIFEKPTANIILTGQSLNAFPLRAGTNKNVHSHYFYLTFY